MKTILVIILVLAAVAGLIWVATKYFGLLSDRDKDGIPDEVEDTYEDIKDKVEDTIEDVKDKVEDIKEDVEDVVDEVKRRAKNVKKELVDVVSAVKGKPTKAKLNSLTKQQLVDAAKADHGADLDVSVKKSTLVNKVYSLYNS